MTNPPATDRPQGGGPSGIRPDPKMLDMLVCPVAYVPLKYDAAAAELISDQAGLAYPIRDGIPVMIPEQARVLDPHTAK